MPRVLTFRPATPADLSAIEALLTAAGLPVEGVRDHMSGFLLAEDLTGLAGVAAIEGYGKQGLLRSVAVREDHRGTGLGVQLTRALIDRARHSGLSTLVLLTTTAEHFFPKFGFVRISREEVPLDVFASREFQGACPACAVVMQLDLAGVNA
ncbi:arsenic resistance N-acetyltransferase ArsN2 [Deinococcus deserti]|uniref:Putative Acetyltransferase, GNAT family n=1 Tax=Deinococcus deserti (strain DSM 17065 / CIP 109153 / LMG 22923 / VCD115) TaxID=546414 RepID=C1CUW0_DEIDV|nr:arsenic resistance N-acetyltransferase ArsN2 [Deinococcus deserti]ACO45977.1 putative Acetyltransferase, GNAT family [Deinococcus deserti VCD115]